MLSTKPVDETDTSRYFRHVFQEKFSIFIHEVNILAKGNAEFNDTWVDTLGKEGIAISSVVIAGIIGLLGALAVLSAAASAGAAIPIAVVGVGLGIVFYKYREYAKQKGYERVAEMIEREDINEDIETISNILANLYKMQLNCCTLKDAHTLAEGCVDGLTAAMLKNKDFNFNELLNPSDCQGVLMRALSSVPKKKLSMNMMTNKKFNLRGLVGHSAYYCRETDEYYQSKNSKSNKYGVLFFENKSDLDDYEAILTSSMRHGEKWKLTKMRPHEVSVLKRSSLFRAAVNDNIFKSEQDAEMNHDNDGMKIH